ncbi:putative ripening-related protein 5 [Aegilops tauschii subsp. strangulata]|uniref:putative ripening-related protein 5 n=1 Tax=Aegilops tauschii subsp. strangulata TaxID=200361 RepID=UPI00098B78B0|nr:putative ripening-related protein 5 [Aegilops tauschii subsp. strangulata]
MPSEGTYYNIFRLATPPLAAHLRGHVCRPHSQRLRQGKDGGFPSECDSTYHDDSEMVVALSIGWFSGMSRCGRSIKITVKGGSSSVYAKVVDECDSVHGCDAEHNYEE